MGNPEKAPISWVDNDKEIHGDGDGAVVFHLEEGNPGFKIDGDYDYMGYDGDGNYKILGISENITVEIFDYYGLHGDEDEEIGDDVASDETLTSAEQGENEGVYSVTFVTNGAYVEVDGVQVEDGFSVDSYKAPSVWVESDGYFVDSKGNKVDEENIGDPEVGELTWIDKSKEIYGDGDGAIKFKIEDSTNGLTKFNFDGEYDHMNYFGNGVYEVIGISEDITIEVITDYNPSEIKTVDDASKDNKDEKKPSKKYLGDINGDSKATAKDSMLIQRYAVNLSNLDDTQKQLADVDGNGKVTNADAMSILRYTVNQNVKYSIGEEQED